MGLNDENQSINKIMNTILIRCLIRYHTHVNLIMNSTYRVKLHMLPVNYTYILMILMPVGKQTVTR